MHRFQHPRQASPTDVQTVPAAEPPLRAELHIPYTASGAGQTGEFIREWADVLADGRVQDGRQVQLLLLNESLRLGAGLAEVHFLFLASDDVGQMHRGRIGTTLAFHAATVLAAVLA